MWFLSLFQNIFLITGISVWLVACGGGGGGNDDSTAPTAQITFSPPVSLTEGGSHRRDWRHSVEWGCGSNRGDFL